MRAVPSESSIWCTKDAVAARPGCARRAALLKDQNEDVAAIVSLIYETAFAPKSWRGLVEKGQASEQPSGAMGTATLQLITPFLERALATAKDQAAAQGQDGAQPTLLQELPIPVCIVSRDLRLLSVTRKAEELFESESALSVVDGSVQAADPVLQSNLAHAVREAIEAQRSGTLSSATGEGTSQVFLVGPVSTDDGQPAAALFLNIELGVFDRLSASLVESYGLTRSEAEVTSHLAQGLSLGEIAERKGSSVNTVRTQVKSVFSKTRTSRQGELVSLVLNGPAVWLRLVKGYAQRPSAGAAAHIVNLEDGRVLSYGDYGPERGRPVFLCHHLLGSRSQKPSEDGLLERLNIRLIVPERPGIGQSTPVEKRRLVDWPEDVRQLADYLRIERFHVLGFSTGGPHAAACAALLDDRVLGLGLVASLMPSDELPEGVATNLTQRFLTGMSRHWPSGIRKLLEIRYQRMLERPDEVRAGFEQQGGGADVQLLRNPEVRRIFEQDQKTAAEVPKRVFASELVMLSQPWGFQLSDLSVPVQLWHGRQDDFFGVDHAEAMATIIPDCSAEFGEGWGHFFLHSEWERILNQLVE